MKASIDIKITYDDLSEACKQKIKKFEKEFDCTIKLVYPSITSTPNNQFEKIYPIYSTGEGKSYGSQLNDHLVRRDYAWQIPYHINECHT